MSDLSAQLQEIVRGQTRRAVHLASNAVMEELQVMVPYDTGELQQSLFMDEPEEYDVLFGRRIGATADQASWTDEGTPPHSIDPTGPWALHWVDSSISAWNPGSGGDVYARHVEHPGFIGTHWFTNATSGERWAQQLQIAFETLPNES